MSNSKPSSSGPVQTRSERLNLNCFCLTLDRRSLCEALEQEAGDPEFCETFIRPKAHLFSNVPVFISASEVAEMQEVVTAIEAAARLATYRAEVLSWAPEISREDHGPVGALMGYDFHLGVDGPRLIEINTNAGGAFLNALLARAQRACCVEMEIPPRPHTFEDAACRMFQDEWRRQRGAGVAHRIAIVDDMRITDGRGVDVAIEALGTQATFEAALRVLRSGGSLSSLGVYSSDIKIPLGAFAAGLGDHTIMTTLCPGGKERMRRLMEVIRSERVDLTPLVTHRFKLDDVEAAYDLFSNQRDGVLKVAITP